MSKLKLLTTKTARKTSLPNQLASEKPHRFRLAWHKSKRGLTLSMYTPVNGKSKRKACSSYLLPSWDPPKAPVSRQALFFCNLTKSYTHLEHRTSLTTTPLTTKSKLRASWLPLAARISVYL